MKIHHFKKRPPSPKDGASGRDRARITLELEHPTLPEMSLQEHFEQAEEEAEAERPEPPARPEPRARAGASAREDEGRGSRRSRGSSRKARAEDEPPPPGSVAERLNTARRLVTESDFDGASAILERLVTLGVATGPVYTQLGAIYMAQGATERALGFFEEALASDPSDLFARVCRGEARLWRGDLRLAREDLQRVLDMGTAGSPLVERAQQLLQRLKEQGDRRRS